MRIKKSVALFLAAVMMITSTASSYASGIEGLTDTTGEIINEAVSMEEVPDISENAFEENTAEENEPDGGTAPEEEPVLYTLTLKLGTTSAGTLKSYREFDQASAFEEGETVHIVATANNHFYFNHWECLEEDVSLNDPTLSDFEFEMPGEDVTLMAYFDEDPFVTVTYLPGKYATTTTSTSFAKKYIGTTLTLKGKTYTPVKSGMYQSGWSLSPEGDTLDYNVGASYTEDVPITLYPYFGQNHTITIVPDEQCVESDVYTYNKNAGAALTIPATLYTNVNQDETIRQYGWCVSGNEIKRKYTTSVTSTDDEDMILVPVWEKRYTYRYHPGEYGSLISGELEDQYTYHYQTLLPTVTGTNNTAGILFARPGYVQVGWNTVDGATSSKYSLNKGYTTITSDLDLYPVWHVNYSFIYSPGEYGEGEEVEVEKVYNRAYIDNSVSFTRNGYTQTKWTYTDGSNTKYLEFGGSITSGTNKNLTFYPVWEENIYPIYVEGIQVRGSNADDILGDGSVKYDSASNTIIFKSADISSNEQFIIKVLKNAVSGETAIKEINISYEDDNLIQALNGEVIASEIPVNVTGEGSLTIISDYPDPAFNGKLSVREGIDVVAGENEEAAVKITDYAEALKNCKYIKFAPEVKEVKKGVIDGYVYIGSERITRGNLSGKGWNYDVESETLTIEDLELREFSQINIDGKKITAGIYSDYDLNLVIKGINAVGNDNNRPEYAIYTKGKLNISGTGAADLYGIYGINASDEASFMGGNVLIRSEKEGLFGIKNVLISGSGVEMYTGDYGIVCIGDLNVLSGSLKVYSNNTAVTAPGNTTVGNADVDIQGGLHGIITKTYTQNGGNVSITTTKDLTGDGNEGLYCYALELKGGLKLLGGTFYSEAQYQTIYAGELGDLVIDGGTMKVRQRQQSHYLDVKGSVVNASMIQAGNFIMKGGELDAEAYAQALFLLSSTKTFDYYGGHVHIENFCGTSKVYCTNMVMTKYPAEYWYINSKTATVLTCTTSKLTTTSKTKIDLYTNVVVSYRPGEGAIGEIVNVPKTTGVALNLKGAIYSRVGFVQTGWSTAQGGPKVYELNASYTADKDIILYPYWTESVIIRYFADDKPETEPIVIEKPLGKKINLQGRIFEREGYLQNGWTTVSGNDIPEYEPGEEYAEDISLDLYATWRDRANVTYLPGLRGRGDAQTISYKVLIDEEISDRLFDRPGYFQSGWSYTDGGEKDFELFDTVNLSDDIVLYPYWTEGYVVEYRMGTNPGVGMVELKEDVTDNDVYFIGKYDEEIVIPEACYEYIAAPGDYSDYVQLGWSYTDNGELEVNFGDKIKLDANLVLYPVWVRDSMWVEVVSDEYSNITPKERIAVFDYNGTKIVPEINVYDGSVKLVAGKDYSVAYKNNINASMTASDLAVEGMRVTDEEAGLNAAALSKLPSIIVTGKGAYSGKQTIYFSIKPVDIGTDSWADSGNVTIEYAEKKGKVVVNKPVPTITGTLNGKSVKLSQGKDFTVSYVGIDVMAGEELAGIAYTGTYYMIVKGTGNYAGSRTLLATVTNKKSVFNATVKNVGALSYTGAELVHPNMKLLYGKTEMKRGIDYTVTYSDNVAVGTGIITITGMGEYEGVRNIEFKINGVDFKKVKIEGFAKAYNYTGEPVKQEYVRFYVENPDETMHFLKENEDYTVTYSDNLLPGVASVTFKGMGGFTGELKKTFKINGEALSKATVENMPKSLSFVYNGGPQTLENTDIYLSMKKSPLRELTPEEYKAHEDGYLVKYITDTSVKGNNTGVGTATVEFVGSGRYTGSIKKTFKITAYDIKSDAQGRVNVYYDETISHAKGGAVALKKVTFTRDDGSEMVLKENTDYKVAYKNNKAVGAASSSKAPQFTVTGKGNLKGSLAAIKFDITTKSLEEVSATAADKAATGKAGAYAATVTLVDTDGKALKAGTDYDKNITYIYMDDVSVNNGGKEIMRHVGDTADKKDIVPSLAGGTHMKAVVKARGNYEGTIELEYRITAQDIKNCKVEYTKKFYYNGGKQVVPAPDEIIVKTKVGKDWVELDKSQYIVDTGSFMGTTGKGTASFVIYGRDGFGGSLTAKYNILAKGIIWWFSQL